MVWPEIRQLLEPLLISRLKTMAWSQDDRIDTISIGLKFVHFQFISTSNLANVKYVFKCSIQCILENDVNLALHHQLTKNRLYQATGTGRIYSLIIYLIIRIHLRGLNGIILNIIYSKRSHVSKWCKVYTHCRGIFRNL